MEEIGKLVLYNLAPSCLIGLVVFFAKRYVDALEGRVEKASNEVERLSGKLYDLSSKVNGILDTVLEKFSRWEDRIKDILSDKYTPQERSAQFEAVSKDTIKELAQLRINVDEIFGEVEKVVGSVEKVSDHVDNQVAGIKHEVEKTLERRVHNLKFELTQVRNHTDSRYDKIDKLVRQLYLVLKSFRLRIDETETNIKVLKSAPKSVVRIYDRDDKK